MGCRSTTRLEILDRLGAGHADPFFVFRRPIAYWRQIKEDTMPNWCSNRLDVFFGNDEEARRFEEKLGEDGKLSMNAFFPRPKALAAFMKAYSDPYGEN